MPAALNLVGKTFGRLTVLAHAGRVKYGSMQPLWRVQCACGVVELLPQSRINRGLASQKKRSDVVSECARCRRRCEVCREPIGPDRGKQALTCSDTCRAQKSQVYHRQWYEGKLREDPQRLQRQRQRRMARAAADQEYAERVKQWQRITHRRRWQRIKEDPEAMEANRASHRAWYAAHAAEVQRRRREILEAKSPEERAQLSAAMREYASRHYARRKQAFAADPSLHEEHKQAQAEWRRKKALGHLQQTVADLADRFDSHPEPSS